MAKEYRWVNVYIDVTDGHASVRVEGRGFELPFAARETLTDGESRRIHYEIHTDGPITDETYTGPGDDDE